jgi:hypothetical protein
MRKSAIVFISLIVVLMLGTLACAGEGATPAVSPTPTLTHTPLPTATPASTALFLKVTSPQDQSTVSTADVTVSGSTIPGAVVSVSVDDSVVIADVDQSGNFQAVVTLEEGPNFIEVDASDPLGNQVSANLSIVYAP